MSTDLHIHLRHERGVPVLVIAGELDRYSSPLLRDRSRELVDVALTEPAAARDVGSPPALSTSITSDQRAVTTAAGPNVLVLDVSGVPFVDSTGLGALVAVLKQVMAHRAGLSIAGASAQLDSTLRSMGLNKIIMLHPTAAAAARDALGSSTPAT